MIHDMDTTSTLALKALLSTSLALYQTPSSPLARLSIRPRSMLYFLSLWLLVLLSRWCLGQENVAWNDPRVTWRPPILSQIKTESCAKNINMEDNYSCEGVWARAIDASRAMSIQFPDNIIVALVSNSSATASVTVGFVGSQIQVFGASVIGSRISAGNATVDGLSYSFNFLLDSQGPRQLFQSNRLDPKARHELRVDVDGSSRDIVYIDHFVVVTHLPTTATSLATHPVPGTGSTPVATATALGSTSYYTPSASKTTPFEQSSSSPIPTGISPPRQRTLPLSGRVGFAMLGITLLGSTAGLILWFRGSKRRRAGRTLDGTVPYSPYPDSEALRNSGPPASPLILPEPTVSDTVKGAEQYNTDTRNTNLRHQVSLTGSTDSRAEVVALQAAMRRAGLSAHALMALLRVPRQEDAEKPPTYER